ncbi:MAG: YaiI/YqxD family protein [Desulfuromonadales bacterium]|nr:YaiI/YqxD family protein [Desulfuromonadales bacterium]MDW7757846.1 YaiI/YqxD family protein [Desulfuromonadales bacterium]
MTIWIDADACPRQARELVFKAAQRLQIPVCLVANQPMSRHHSPLITSVHVHNGFDAADDHIAESVAPGDLVISADIPLAARVVAAGGEVIDPRGDLLDQNNVGERLSLRDLLADLRNDGVVSGGPAPFGPNDRKRFAATLDRTLTRLARAATAKG